MSRYDIARVRNVSSREAEGIIERGRAKLATWLKLVATAEDVEPHIGAIAAVVKDRIDEYRKALPLDLVVDMTPSRWCALVLRHDALMRETLRSISPRGTENG